MKKYFLLPTAFLLSVLLIFSCKKEKEDLSDNFDRSALLANIGNNIIVPNFLSFKAKAELLDAKAEAFAASPDTNSLSEVQKAFKDAYLAWQRVETFKFGPLDEVYMLDTLNEFPVDSIKLSQKISSGESFSSSAISNYAANIKGFASLDFLLFHHRANTGTTLTDFTTDVNAAKRKEFLIAMTEYIKEKATVVSNKWTSGYINTFNNNNGVDAASSLALLVNQYNFHLDYIVNKRLANPLGMKIGLVPNPKMVEGYYSQTSLDNILEGLQNLEDVFLGRSNGIDGIGLDDYLSHLQAKDSFNGDLVEATKTNFANSKNAIKQIAPTLAEAIVKEPSIVENAYRKLRRLQVNSKAEMPSALGVMISYTDNDGD